jgi:hypothetical protein
MNTTPNQDQAQIEAANSITETFIKHYEFLKELHGENFHKAIEYDEIAFFIRWNMADNDQNEFKSALQMMQAIASDDKVYPDQQDRGMLIKQIAAVATSMTMDRLDSDDLPESMITMHPFRDTIVSVQQAKQGFPNMKVCPKCKVVKVTDRQTYKTYYYKKHGLIAYQSPKAPACVDLRSIGEIKQADHDAASHKEW